MIAQLLRRNAHRLPVPVLRTLGNLWSPFRGAGIRIAYISPDFREIRVELKLRWYNRNYVGTHFGGSLYAMTDPFYMMMLINNLGPGYIVWDKGAVIDFKKPGRGIVRTRFVFRADEIQAIKAQADELGKYVFERPAEIVDEHGEVVASVMKTLYVRRRENKTIEPTRHPY
jgi:acyl-coenzyme A thioesterase PaaI-like protein